MQEWKFAGKNFQQKKRQQLENEADVVVESVEELKPQSCGLQSITSQLLWLARLGSLEVVEDSLASSSVKEQRDKASNFILERTKDLQHQKSRYPFLCNKESDGDDLSSFSFIVTSKTQNRRVRPLLNVGNHCFLNGALQGLLACGMLMQVLKRLDEEEEELSGRLQTLEMRRFAARFHPEWESVLDSKAGTIGDNDRALHAASFFQVLTSGWAVVAMGSMDAQHDVGEFLQFVLDRLSEECKWRAPSKAGSDDEWAEVGKRGKKASTRVSGGDFESYITRIFGGWTQRRLEKSFAASLTKEPFIVLNLAVQDDATLEDLLCWYCQGESEAATVEEGPRRKKPSSSSLSFVSLPPTLLLSLKRSQFDRHQKCHIKSKASIHYPMEFVPPTCVVDKNCLVTPPKYELVAVLNHIGRFSTSGHCVARTRTADGSWFFLDDGMTPKSTSPLEVLQQKTDCSVLIYSAIEVGTDLRPHIVPSSVNSA